MAGHRSPCGRRAHRNSELTLARCLVANRPAPISPSLRTTVLATAAAVGAVATGTLTALLPTPGDPTTVAAAADEGQVGAVLAANTTALPTRSPAATPGVFQPVTLAFDRAVSDGGGSDGTAGNGTAGDADEHLARLDKAATLAAELAELHTRQQREQAERDRVAALVDRGDIDGWIAEALQIMDLPQSLAPGIKRIIMAESGGNPRAVNNWDSNARHGTPSQGLMQTIPSTYRTYVHPALADRPITDPVANITAGVRYMVANYGIDTLEAGGRSSRSGGYVGY